MRVTSKGSVEGQDDIPLVLNRNASVMTKNSEKAVLQSLLGKLYPRHVRLHGGFACKASQHLDQSQWPPVGSSSLSCLLSGQSRIKFSRAISPLRGMTGIVFDHLWLTRIRRLVYTAQVSRLFFNSHFRWTPPQLTVHCSAKGTSVVWFFSMKATTNVPILSLSKEKPCILEMNIHLDW